MDQERTVDLVLEGGGVKGIALAGAAVALSEHGFSFARIGGSSAGALVGAITAAMQHAAEPMSRVDDIMRTIDYESFLDRRRMGRLLAWWPTGAHAWGVLFHLGAYRGQRLHDWLTGVLGEFGVRTFGDLRFDDPGGALGPDRSYRLVVTTTNLSRQRVMYLPWDLPGYERDPDTFEVARAVRASASIPFLFEPVRMQGAFGVSTLADGSLLSSYPIEIFDRQDGRPPRWPTVGVRLSTPAGDHAVAKPVDGPVSLLQHVLFTVADSTQVRYVRDPESLDRSIFAKPKGVRWTDFDLTPDQQEVLFAAGHVAATKWLARHGNRPPMRPHSRSGL